MPYKYKISKGYVNNRFVVKEQKKFSAAQAGASSIVLDPHFNLTPLFATGGEKCHKKKGDIGQKPKRKRYYIIHSLSARQKDERSWSETPT